MKPKATSKNAQRARVGRRFLFLAAVLSGCAALPSCARAPKSPSGILVCVTETDGVYVTDNGQRAEPGETVTFRLSVAPGVLVTGADYDGGCRITEQGGYTVLTLEDVRFPTRVCLDTETVDLSARYVRTISYEPNGGEGTPFSVSSSILTHTRPNTAQGGFSREGFTLVGWNSEPDGSGIAVGLGSRVTVPEEGLTLYACWEAWTDAACFDFVPDGDGIRITGYHGSDRTLTVPAVLDGTAVTIIGCGAFTSCPAEEVILPPGIIAIEDGAFCGCPLRSLTLFDSLKAVGDAAFTDCDELKTLHINAAEDPYGYAFRRESLFADKADLLINSQGQKKLVFYGGCSMWYNLIGSEASHAFGDDYRVINMGLNGTVNSLVQMEIIGSFLEEGDLFFHAPELSSKQQLLTDTAMYDGDDKLWCGLEYNYDLLALVDLRGIRGVFDSLAHYLAEKKPGGSYGDDYRDANGMRYLDETGGIPWIRTQGRTRLDDEVSLDPAALSDGLPALADMYEWYLSRGVTVYLSYACVNTDALPEEQKDGVEEMDRLFRQTIEAMDGPILISRLSDYLYTKKDFYDTNYHLLTPAAYRNTALWLRDLTAWQSPTE